MLFAMPAVGAQLDRDYIRYKTLEGQQAAAARGRHGGRPTISERSLTGPQTPGLGWANSIAFTWLHESYRHPEPRRSA
jgi:hypothetical protein